VVVNTVVGVPFAPGAVAGAVPPLGNQAYPTGLAAPYVLPPAGHPDPTIFEPMLFQAFFGRVRGTSDHFALAATV